MGTRIAGQRIDPARPLQDAEGRLIGMGDHVKHVCGPDFGTVIGTVTIGGIRYVRSERENAGTYATAPGELTHHE